MDDKIKKQNNQNPIVMWFCGIVIITLVLLIMYLCYSTMNLAESQDRIVTEHVEHISRVDSLFIEMKEVILSNDSGKIANAPALLSQLQKDSAIFKREVLLSQEEMNNLVELHINKIENDYAQIGIWGGVLSIIFIIFGFFAIFKLEDTKSEAQQILKDVVNEGNKAKAQIEQLQSQALELNGILNSIKQEGTSLCQNKEKEFNDLFTNLSEILSQADKDTTNIQNILKEAEDKNGKYQMSLDAMEKQLRQFENLSTALNEVLDNMRKEATNE